MENPPLPDSNTVLGLFLAKNKTKFPTPSPQHLGACQLKEVCGDICKSDKKLTEYN